MTILRDFDALDYARKHRLLVCVEATDTFPCRVNVRPEDIGSDVEELNRTYIETTKATP